MTKQILIDEDKVKLALKELETWKRFTHGENEHTNKAIKALEEALAKQEHGEPVADPFADIHDKRIGELTAEQQDRAVEFWLRKQKGWLSMSEREHVEALLRVIDNLRTTSQQRQSRSDIKPLTEEQKHELVTNWFAEDWAIKKAMGLLDDYEAAHGITSATDFKE